MDDFMDILDYMDFFDDFDQPTSVPTRGYGRQYFESYEDSLGYEVEYAKSGRSKCQLCRQSISNATLRLGIIVSSPYQKRATISRWYHSNCFFYQEDKPSSVIYIDGFRQLRIEDQDAIRDKLEFRVEYAKSDRSTCQGCLKKIPKGEVRISKKDCMTADARGMGGWDKWHHVDCFAKHRLSVEYYGSGDELHGAAILSREERERLKAALPKIIRSDVTPPAKKFRSESQPPPKMIKTPEDTKETRLMKKQAEELSITKDLISKLENTEILAFLIRNNQEVPTNIVDLASDILYFGALEPCPSCKGQLIFNSNFGYKCTGNAIEQTKCEYVTQNPKRRKCEIPNEMKTFSFQKFHALTKSKLKKRMFNIPAIEMLSMPSSSSSIVREEAEVDAPKISIVKKEVKVDAAKVSIVKEEAEVDAPIVQGKQFLQKSL